jgi:hypothetical protein
MHPQNTQGENGPQYQENDEGLPMLRREILGAARFPVTAHPAPSQGTGQPGRQYKD